MKHHYRSFHLLSQVKMLTVIFFLFMAGAVSAQSYTWSNLPVGAGGFVSAVIPSTTEEGLVYARTDVGGAYRWDQDNATWIPLNDWTSEELRGFLGVESLALDPQNPNRVYMLVGISYFSSGRTAILKSEDYGETFEIIEVTSQFKAHGNGMGRQTGEKLVVDPNNSNILYCGTRWDGLFKSTDAGETWSRVDGLDVTTTPNENGISFVLPDGSDVSDGNTQTLYVGVSRSGSNNLYRSTDGGETFSAVPGAPSAYMPHRAVLAGDGDLYITYANGAGPHEHWNVDEPMNAGEIQKYDTENDTWTNVTPSGDNNAFGGISADPDNPERLIASTINVYKNQYTHPTEGIAWGDRILISTDGGTSWTDVVERGFNLDENGSPWIGGHAIHWSGSIEFDPFNTSKVWITSGNGIFTTDDIDANTTTWRFEVDNLEETVPLELVSVEKGPVVSVIGDYDGFRHMDVTSYAPIHKPRIGTTTGLDYAEQNPDIMLRVGGDDEDNQMYYSTDMAQTWTESSSVMGPQGRVAVSADGNVFLHCPGGESTTYRSTDNGGSWSAVNGLNITDAKPVSDPVNADKFYAYNSNNGFMMVSTDGGQSFSAAGSPGTGGSKVVETTPGREGHLWVAMHWGGLKRSTNSGQSFVSVDGVTDCGAVGLGKAAPGEDYPTVYIWGTVDGTEGIYRSTDQGESWVRINDDDHQYGGPGNGQFVVGDMNVFGRVYMSTAGRGIIMGNPGTTDCAGVTGGTAFIDACDNCAGGSTGVTPELDPDNCAITGVSNSLSEKISLYPNPFTSSIKLEMSGKYQYVIYDLRGKAVESGEGSGVITVANSLPAGTYMIEVIQGDESAVKRVTKY